MMTLAATTIITVDGPSGVGKGTLCRLLAKQLGFHLLDSGALYRITALAALNAGVSLDDEQALALLARGLSIQFKVAEEGTQIYLMAAEVTDTIRMESIGKAASLVAPLQKVRDALLDRQRQFARPPGLVADGRDMGTIVFKEAPCKFYLTASAEERARRRILQLQNAGSAVDEAAVMADIIARDERDMNRAVAPLKPAPDAVVIDTTHLSIEQVLSEVLRVIRQKNV
jgi:CMP/dCMP kinase